jgi:hypothetical protein
LAIKWIWRCKKYYYYYYWGRSSPARQGGN